LLVEDPIAQIEAGLQEEGGEVLSALLAAVRALKGPDLELADELIAFDDEIDRRFLAIKHSIETALALRSPVANDLRLLLAMLHINLLLERTADSCVTVAKLVKVASAFEPDPALVEVLIEMASAPRKCGASRSTRSPVATSTAPRASSTSTN